MAIEPSKLVVYIVPQCDQNVLTKYSMPAKDSQTWKAMLVYFLIMYSNIVKYPILDNNMWH